MLSQLKNKYSLADYCYIPMRTTEVHLIDKGGVRVLEPNQREDADFSFFKGISSRQEPVIVLVDGCMLGPGVPTRRCDIVGFDENSVVFLELKNCKPHKVSTHRADGMDQIIKNLDFFKRDNINYGGRRLYAIICINQAKFCRLPSMSTELQSFSRKFATRGVNFLVTREFTFS